MFRTSIVHLQERSYAVCCNLVCLDTSRGWRKNCSSSFNSPSSGAFLCCMLQYGSSRYVMRVKEELLCSSSFTLIKIGRIETYQIATYSIRTLLKMDCWSPKHVELLKVTNKINHKILCILLDYRYIVYSHIVVFMYVMKKCEGGEEYPIGNKRKEGRMEGWKEGMKEG